MKKGKVIDEQALVRDYAEGMSLTGVTAKYHIEQRRARKIITDHGITIRSCNSRGSYEDNNVIKYTKFCEEDGYHYVAIAKHDGTEIDDPYNRGGHLGKYVRDVLGLDVPPLYAREKYYHATGDNWFEQFFDFEKRKNKETKKCPYCDFETIDVNNHSGWFGQHLKRAHNITVEEHLKNHPEDIDFFKKYKRNNEREELLENENNRVTCPICGKAYGKLTFSHFKKHGLTMEQFYELYPEQKMVSERDLALIKEAQKKGNLTVGNNHFISKRERQIRDFLNEHGVDIMCNRQILEGREIDILVKSRKIGIEYDGVLWHSEFYGKKNSEYHLQKTELCERHNYRLVHITEDEHYFHQKVVYKRLSEILQFDDGLPTVNGGDCFVEEMSPNSAKRFINAYGLEPQQNADYYICAKNGGYPICVVGFRLLNENRNTWEIFEPVESHFQHLSGVIANIWDYFFETKKPWKVITFIDRKWYTKYDNPVINIGFNYVDNTLPDYFIIGKRGHNNASLKRRDKCEFTKEILQEQYGYPDDMAYEDMLKAAKLDRVWDCGRMVFEWINDVE